MPECDAIRQRRILIINEGTLLTAGLHSLLSHYPGLEVVALTPPCSAELMEELVRFRPDLILLAGDGTVTSPPELLAMLGDYPLVRVVAVSCDCNTVYVYDRSPVTITAVSDLLALIPAPGSASAERTREPGPSIMKGGGIDLHTSTQRSASHRSHPQRLLPP